MRVIIALIAAIPFMSLAEPFCDALKVYSELYDAVVVDCMKIEEAVKSDYGMVYFAMNQSGTITDALKRNEVVDTIIDGHGILIRKSDFSHNEIIRKFDYEKLESSRNAVKMMLDASIPTIDKFGKTIAQKHNYYDTPEFNEAVLQFQGSMNTLIEIVSVIQEREPEFLSDYGSLASVEDINSWGAWYKKRLEIKQMHIDKALFRFEKKYSAQSEKLNLVEVLLINTVPLFRGNISGPSSLEPIFRITAVSYNFTDHRFVKAAQVGLNYYFLDGGFLANVHHVGVAVLIADISSEEIYQFEKPSIGVMLHIGKYQFGIVNDTRDDDLKFVAAVDFQIIPKLF